MKRTLGLATLLAFLLSFGTMAFAANDSASVLTKTTTMQKKHRKHRKHRKHHHKHRRHHKKAAKKTT
jgi:Ni/Co efflux regulator RcnB